MIAYPVVEAQDEELITKTSELKPRDNLAVPVTLYRSTVSSIHNSSITSITLMLGDGRPELRLWLQ